MQNCTKGTFERPFINISEGLLSDLIGWWDDCKGKQGKMGCNRERLPSYPLIPSSAQSRCHPIHLTPSGSPCRTDRSQRPTTPGTALAGGESRALVNVLDLLTYPKTASCQSICNWLHTPDLYIKPYNGVHACGCLCWGVSLHLPLSLISSAETIPALTGLNSYYSSNMFDRWGNMR